MGSNPILMMQAVGSSLVRAKRALVKRPIVIAAAVCDGEFNAADFPPYEAAFELLQSCQHPADMVQHQELLATDPVWVDRYRHHYGYHPFHAFSMIYVGGIARDHSSAVYVAGAKRPDLARAMGARTTTTVEEALREADGLPGPRRRACSPSPRCRSRPSTWPPRRAAPSDGDSQLVDHLVGAAAVRRTATQSWSKAARP